jgi:hypothetical protein
MSDFKVGTMKNMSELQNDRKAKQQSDRLVWDMKDEILKITPVVLRNLDLNGLSQLAKLFHPKGCLSNLSRSEQNQLDDEIACVVSHVKSGIR